MTGPGLGGRDGGPRHQVHVGPGDPGGVGRQDDRTVHLGQLRQALGAELGVQQEPSRADGEHRRVVADHDERAPLGLQDPVEPLAQRRARCDQGQRLGQRLRARSTTAASYRRRPERRRRRRPSGPRHSPRGAWRRWPRSGRVRPTASGPAVPAPRSTVAGAGAGRPGAPGTRAPVKPRRAASARRRSPRAPGGPRRPDPTSPMPTMLAGRAHAGHRRGDRQGQRQIGRRLGGPHPAGRRDVELRAAQPTPARHSSTASRKASRPASTPWALRRGPAPRRRASGRPGPGTRPAAAAGPAATRHHGAAGDLGQTVARAAADRGPPHRPARQAPISKSPTSPVAPNRCLTARSMRRV